MRTLLAKVDVRRRAKLRAAVCQARAAAPLPFVAPSAHCGAVAGVHIGAPPADLQHPATALVLGATALNFALALCRPQFFSAAAAPGGSPVERATDYTPIATDRPPDMLPSAAVARYQ